MIQRITTISLFCAAFCSDLSMAGAELSPSVAIFGDDLALGVGTDPRLNYNGDSLWDYLKAIVPFDKAEVLKSIGDFVETDLAPPTRLERSIREFNGARPWLIGHLFSLVVDRYFSTPQLGWGYLIGSKLGAKGKDIAIAADVEMRIRDLSVQADRYLNHNQILPNYAVVMFAFYDFCAQRMSLLPSSVDYAKALDRGLRYLVRNGQANPSGTTVYISAPPSVTQLILSESILDKKVFAHGEERTCRQLSDQAFAPSKPMKEARHVETLYFNAFFPPNPAHYCPTLFARRLIDNELGFFSSLGREQRDAEISKSADNMISALSSRLRAFRKQSAQVVNDLNAWAKVEYPGKKVTFVYLAGTENLDLAEKDIAGDCFHFSAEGQKKIALAMWDSIQPPTL